MRPGQLIRRRNRRVKLAGITDDLYEWLLGDSDEAPIDDIEAHPESYAEVVEHFIQDLFASHDNLMAIAAIQERSPDPEEQAAWSKMVERYNSLLLGFLADAKADNDALPQEITIGILPLLVVSITILGVAGSAGVVAVSAGAAAIAWADVGKDYAANLHEETDLKRAEAEMRDVASREGRTLQDSTLKPPDDDDKDDEGLPWWAILLPIGLGAGVLAVAAAKMK